MATQLVLTLSGPKHLHRAGLVVLLALWALLPGCGQTTADLSTLPTEQFTLNGHTLTVELALNKPDRVQGLSDRPGLADDRGMLFVFPTEQPMGFVMRRCHFDIDLAFINAAGQVVATHQMTVQPLDTLEKELTVYATHEPALMALELNAGGLERYGLTPGLRLDLPILELKRRAL